MDSEQGKKEEKTKMTKISKARKLEFARNVQFITEEDWRYRIFSETEIGYLLL